MLQNILVPVVHKQIDSFRKYIAIMPKRPPQPYAAAPPTASVSASRSASASNDDDAGASWDETKQIIRDLIAEYTTSDVAQTAKDCLTLNAMLEDKQREVVAAADAQIDALNDQIRAANEACGAATDDLRAHSEHIAQLEADAAELRRKNDALTAARREAEARVARFRAEADEQIDGIDAVEADRMEEVPKIQMQIALYAKVVGIKWDYDESVGGMLKGEVAVPSKGVCRQFEIDSNEHDEFDVANELWSLMEGKQSALTC